MSGVQWVKRLLRHVRRRLRGDSRVSRSYAFIQETGTAEVDGWRATSVAERQHGAFAALLQSARDGSPRVDFVVAAQAVAATGLPDPLLVEVGCGSGYYSEVLPLLLQRPVRYTGVDYAASMTTLARRTYPGVPFVTGDACHLPLATGCCDILLNGGSLMHIVEYRQAVAESVRASRQWCVFHTVPVMTGRPTTLLRKNAYGGPVLEVIFNQGELETLLTEKGLEIHTVFESIPYDLQDVIGEHTWTLTYLCRKKSRIS